MKRKDLQVIRTLIRQALKEDIGKCDITTVCTVPEKLKAKGHFIAKEPGVIAGLEVARETLRCLDPRATFSPYVKDGSWVTKGTLLAMVNGKCRALLTAERTSLNFLQRMSGIATATRRYTDAVKGTKAVILDTRKTAPGLRLLDKWAVRIGGGKNHRIGLFDMVLIKENHIAAAGGIKEAVENVCKKNKNIKIEIEVRSIDELNTALELNVDRILLDNMTPDKMREAVKIAGGRKELEASGNINLSNAASVAATGVDFISIGGLTHSVQALDISFLIEMPKK